MPSASHIPSKQDMQSRSNVRNAIEGQGELPLTRPPQSQPIGEEVIFAQRSFSAAVALGIAASGLDDKEIYIPLGIDASHWTKIRKGEAHFPVDKLNQFCNLVGNEIPLIWWAHSRGKGLHMLETEAQRLLRASCDREQRLADENKLLRELVQGRA